MDALDVAVFSEAIEAALWWYGVPLLVLAVAFGFSVARFRPGHSCTDAATYGAGPCGVARVTRPAMDGLSVREHW